MRIDIFFDIYNACYNKIILQTQNQNFQSSLPNIVRYNPQPINIIPTRQYAFIDQPYLKKLISPATTTLLRIKIVSFPACLVIFKEDINKIWDIAIPHPENKNAPKKVVMSEGQIDPEQQVTEEVKMNSSPKKQLILIPGTCLMFFCETIPQAQITLLSRAMKESNSFTFLSSTRQCQKEVQGLQFQSYREVKQSAFTVRMTPVIPKATPTACFLFMVMPFMQQSITKTKSGPLTAIVLLTGVDTTKNIPVQISWCMKIDELRMSKPFISWLDLKSRSMPIILQIMVCVTKIANPRARFVSKSDSLCSLTQTKLKGQRKVVINIIKTATCSLPIIKVSQSTFCVNCCMKQFSCFILSKLQRLMYAQINSTIVQLQLRR